MSNEHNNAAPIAYLTEDGERCITAKTYNTARNDGGAIWSTMRPFCVPAYATTLPAAAPAPAVPDVELRPEDFMVEVLVTPMGGFNPNVTHGVRVTHKPTGLSVSCDTERSQHKNRHIAFEQIKEMLADHFKITPQPPATPSQEHAVNLSCRSTQARLAAQWGYVPAPSQPAVPQGEPVDFDSIIADIEAIDCVYRGDPSYDYDPRDIREQAANVVRHHATHYVTPAAPSQPAVPLTDEWVSVGDQKPPTNKPVLLHYLDEHQRSKIVRAHYIPAKTVEAGEDDAAEEYDAESDTYFVQEGWYEDNSESEVNYGITGQITHWRNLPLVPAIIAALREKEALR